MQQLLGASAFADRAASLTASAVPASQSGIPSAFPAITRINPLNARRIDELSLASFALFGLVHHRGPVGHAHQAEVQQHIDTLFGLTPAESDRAHDMLFEATLNHAIHDTDRPRIEKCALRLAEIASTYCGTDAQDREIWLAGFELFEIDSLFDASQPRARFDPVFADTAASFRYFDRI